MTNLHELFDDATTAAPPSRLSVEDVFTARRLRRQRRRLRNVVASIAAAVIAAAGGIVVTANFNGHPPVGAAPPGPIVWAQRADSMHLYLVKDTCGRVPSSTEPTPNFGGQEEVCNELLASSDGGATWLSRGAVKYPPVVVGPQTLMRGTGRPPATPDPSADFRLAIELSSDGGTTWGEMPRDGAPLDAVPPGGTLLDGDPLMVFDPAQGRVRPLAHQPTLRRGPGETIVAGPKDIWVSGLNLVTMKHAVAVSHDAGATWTERDMPGAAAIPQPTLPNGQLDPNISIGGPLRLIAGDGVTAYATIWDGSPEPNPASQIPGTEGFIWLRTYRTTDGGMTWQAVGDGATTPSYARGWAATGGRIVVALGGQDGGQASGGGPMGRFAVSTDGLTYAPAVLPGLPKSLISIDGSTAYSNRAMYVSDDGWTWREVWRY